MRVGLRTGLIWGDNKLVMASLEELTRDEFIAENDLNQLPPA